MQNLIKLALQGPLKDVLMGIQKSDLLGVTMAVIHVAGQGSTVTILEVIGRTVVK